jgi:hypothetical protein
MMRFSRATFAIVAIAATAASTLPANAQRAAKPQDSPWAMRAPATPAPGAAATQAAAKVERPEITPAQREFAGRLIAAMGAKDLAKMNEMVAPTVRACFNKDTQPYLDELLKKQMKHQVPKDYKLRVGSVPPQVSGPSKYATIPLAPTQVLEIEFSQADNSITLNRLIAQEHGKWYMVTSCPTAAGMDRFRQLAKIRQAGHDRAQKFMAQVTPPLKAQVIAYVDKGDNADAWKLCMKTLHVDFYTARELVSMLAGESAD